MGEASGDKELELRVHASEERMRLVEAAGEIASFELELDSNRWNWSQGAVSLLGLAGERADSSLVHWEKAVFFDDVPKIRMAVETASSTRVIFMLSFVSRVRGSQFAGWWREAN